MKATLNYSKLTRKKLGENLWSLANGSSSPPGIIAYERREISPTSTSLACLQGSYRIAIQTEGMIEDLVKNLSCDNQELQMHCASAIFKVIPPSPPLTPLALVV